MPVMVRVVNPKQCECRTPPPGRHYWYCPMYEAAARRAIPST
jgi:hypothetical protein